MKLIDVLIIIALATISVVVSYLWLVLLIISLGCIL